MIYYVINRNAIKEQPFLKGKWGKDYLVSFVNPTQLIDQTVQLMISSIKSFGLGKKSIDVIHLSAHGNAGILQLGIGLGASNAWRLGLLAPYLKTDVANPGIILHGCSNASDVKVPRGVKGSFKSTKGLGYKMLYAIAKSTKRIVKAGINDQFDDTNWEIEGPALYVRPNGLYAFSN